MVNTESMLFHVIWEDGKRIAVLVGFPVDVLSTYVPATVALHIAVTLHSNGRNPGRDTKNLLPSSMFFEKKNFNVTMLMTSPRPGA